ncbi:hypothetical protein LMG27177_03678 [Paraburkholderia fynbosensis]|uniref:Porin domain-containing protein n=1 Tax=Paraburkholderia fynbosensis TaxID=1200993 RepID=A0A6J5G908_9BURK|nr:hypothetical protein LMG27177_03678 [Paraburkholderia fynbosensis]
MKQYLLTPLAIALAGFTGAAHAQSSVTLYGIVDAGIGYVHNADGNKKQVGMINGNMNGNRWGIKGSEDLGGGLKAVFQLESGFDPGTGKLNQGGREFGRQAFVGLTSDKYGTVTLGRQYDPLVDMVQGITGDNFFGGIFATPGDVDNYDNSLRTSNAVKYVSPTYAGFQVEGLYGFSNGAGTTGQGHTWSGAATYNNGPVSLAAGYFYANNPTANRTTGWKVRLPTRSSIVRSITATLPHTPSALRELRVSTSSAPRRSVSRTATRATARMAGRASARPRSTISATYSRPTSSRRRCSWVQATRT